MLNKSSHRSITYVHKENINKAINTHFFTHLDPISSEIYEVKSLKKHIIQNLPVHLGLSVYCESKVHMLKFYYLFLKKYLEDKCFTPLFSDTDSIYVAISRPTLDDCVKPSLRKEYFTVKRKWMPADSCNDHFDKYLECKLNKKEWKPSQCCQNFKKHENRTLALFKQEYQGQNSISLAPKSYFCSGEDGNKSGSKGVQIKQNNLSFKDYQQVLETGIPKTVQNVGFRSHKHNMYTYKQKKFGLSNFYTKRRVLNDGIHTEPIDL